MKINTVSQWDFTHENDPVLDTTDIVDRDGYRDTEHTIMEMINAGERLAQYRRGEFDIEDTDDFDKVEEYVDPTRNGIDPADAGILMKNLKSDVDAYNQMVEDAKEKAAKEKAAEEKRIKDGNI